MRHLPPILCFALPPKTVPANYKLCLVRKQGNINWNNSACSQTDKVSRFCYQ